MSMVDCKISVNTLNVFSLDLDIASHHNIGYIWGRKRSCVVSNPQEVPADVYIIVNQNIYPIKKSVTTIGRKIDNDIVIQDDYISRNHAEIRYEDGKFFLYDKKSSGGTFVNTTKINKSALISGDLVLLANVPFIFIDEGEKLRKSSEVTTGKLKN